MPLKKHLILGIALILVMGLASLQGRRMDGLRDSTKFYRWMISASTQARIFGESSFSVEGEDGPEYLDSILFKRLVDVTEARLEDPQSMGDNDLDVEGKLLPKIVRYSNLHAQGSDEDSVETTVDSDEILERDRELWTLARNNETDVASLRTDFLGALRNGQLYSVGEQINLEDFYNQTTDFGVSLSNMFFGFRKMAANLVWLEVDKFFHSGMAHRMIPAMQTTVALDPTFVDAYLLGGWHLAYNFTAKMTNTPWSLREYDTRNQAWVGQKERYYYEAATFLKDGIRKNPREYKIYFDLGYGVYYEKLDDDHNAARFLREAIRPAHDVWVRRQLYRIMSLDDQFEGSIAGWDWYIDQYPNNLAAPRLRRQAIGLMHERDANRAAAKAHSADRMAELEPARASEWQQAAEAAHQLSETQWDEAMAVWDELATSVGSADTFAIGRRFRRDALLKAEQERYSEAIAMLDVARWESNPFWDEASDLMIDYKIISGEPLTVTELKARNRIEERDRYSALTPKSRDGILYSYRDGAWRSSGYQDQPTQDVQPDSLAHHRLQFDHPEIANIVDLGGEVIFKVEEQWYRFKAPALTGVIDPTARG
jgi:hypothetical protein